MPISINAAKPSELIAVKLKGGHEERLDPAGCSANRSRISSNTASISFVVLNESLGIAQML